MRRFDSGGSLIRAGEHLPEKEKPGLFLGFLYKGTRVDVQRIGNGE